MKKFIKIPTVGMMAVSVVSILMFSGCTSGAPTEKDVLQAQQERYKKRATFLSPPVEKLNFQIDNLKCQDRGVKVDGGDSYICDYTVSYDDVYTKGKRESEDLKGIKFYKINDRWDITDK